MKEEGMIPEQLFTDENDNNCTVCQCYHHTDEDERDSLACITPDECRFFKHKDGGFTNEPPNDVDHYTQ